MRFRSRPSRYHGGKGTKVIEGRYNGGGGSAATTAIERRYNGGGGSAAATVIERRDTGEAARLRRGSWTAATGEGGCGAWDSGARFSGLLNSCDVLIYASVIDDGQDLQGAVAGREKTFSFLRDCPWFVGDGAAGLGAIRCWGFLRSKDDSV